VLSLLRLPSQVSLLNLYRKVLDDLSKRKLIRLLLCNSDLLKCIISLSMYFLVVFNHEVLYSRSIISVKVQWDDFKGSRTRFISFWMLYDYSLAVRGGSSRLPCSKPSLTVRLLLRESHRVLSCGSEKLKGDLWPIMLCLHNGLPSALQDCEVAWVNQGYQRECQNLELILLIQETEEDWHPLKIREPLQFATRRHTGKGPELVSSSRPWAPKPGSCLEG